MAGRVIYKTVTKGLVLYIDAGNPKSYVSGSTIVTDLAGTQNGTLTNGVGYSSTASGCFTFDGANDYIDFGINNAIRTASARTISIWVNINSGYGYFLSETNASGYQGAELWFDTGGFRSVVCGVSTYQVAVNYPVANYNTWHYKNRRVHLLHNTNLIQLYLVMDCELHKVQLP